MIGYEELVKTFKSLINNNRLSQSYIFFGEEKIGKKLFALNLANYLETGNFADSSQIFQDLILIRPEGNSLGIDAARSIKDFLARKPVLSSRRTVIIDDAQALTFQAQNALLKIAEDAPPSALFILIVRDAESLFPTLSSRFQKIYFRKPNGAEIKKYLKENYKLSDAEAEKLAKDSFGQIGRIIEWLEKGRPFKGSMPMTRQEIKELISDENFNFKIFLEEQILLASESMPKNYKLLSRLLKLRKIADFNLNPRIQLENLIRNI